MERCLVYENTTISRTSGPNLVLRLGRPNGTSTSNTIRSVRTPTATSANETSMDPRLWTNGHVCTHFDGYHNDSSHKMGLQKFQVFSKHLGLSLLKASAFMKMGVYYV